MVNQQEEHLVLEEQEVEDKVGHNLVLQLLVQMGLQTQEVVVVEVVHLLDLVVKEL